MRGLLSFPVLILFCNYFLETFCASVIKNHTLVVFAPHKSGSMFIHNYFAKLGNIINYVHYSENNHPDKKLSQSDYMTSDAKFKILAPCRANWHLSPLVLVPFSDDMSIVIHWRDPRDVMVSKYYSFGWIHAGPKPGDPHYEGFMTAQYLIRNMTIDEYVLSILPGEKKSFIQMVKFLQHPPVERSQIYISYYGDMVGDFENWHQGICDLFGLKAPFCVKAYRHTKGMVVKGEGKVEFGKKRTVVDVKNLKEINSVSLHKRDSSTGQYLRELQPETLQILHRTFDPIISIISNLQWRFNAERG